MGKHNITSSIVEKPFCLATQIKETKLPRGDVEEKELQAKINEKNAFQRIAELERQLLYYHNISSLQGSTTISLTSDFRW